MNRGGGGGQKHICFYSNGDKWSKAFIEELSKTPWFKEFQFICVDPGPNRPALPKWLKQVPTLVIDGENPPVKTDTDVMNWLYERKQREAPPKPPQASAAAAAPLTGDPVSWIDGEMGGGGNAGYSFIDSDTTAQGNGGFSIPGAFSFLNGGSSPGDRQGNQVSLGQAVSQQAGRTKKEAMFDQQMELYKQQREMGIPKGLARQ